MGDFMAGPIRARTEAGFVNCLLSFWLFIFSSVCISIGAPSLSFFIIQHCTTAYTALATIILHSALGVYSEKENKK